MKDDKCKMNKKLTGIFAAGVLFGTAGIKILTSKDAQNVYAHVTAAVLRAKEYVLDLAANVQEKAEDIYSKAQNMNETRAQQAEVIETEEVTETVTAE